MIVVVAVSCYYCLLAYQYQHQTTTEERGKGTEEKIKNVKRQRSTQWTIASSARVSLLSLRIIRLH